MDGLIKLELHESDVSPDEHCFSQDKKSVERKQLSDLNREVFYSETRTNEYK